MKRKIMRTIATAGLAVVMAAGGVFAGVSPVNTYDSAANNTFSNTFLDRVAVITINSNEAIYSLQEGVNTFEIGGAIITIDNCKYIFVVTINDGANTRTTRNIRPLGASDYWVNDTATKQSGDISVRVDLAHSPRTQQQSQPLLSQANQVSQPTTQSMQPTTTAPTQPTEQPSSQPSPPSPFEPIIHMTGQGYFETARQRVFVPAGWSVVEFAAGQMKLVSNSEGWPSLNEVRAIVEANPGTWFDVTAPYIYLLYVLPERTELNFDITTGIADIFNSWPNQPRYINDVGCNIKHLFLRSYRSSLTTQERQGRDIANISRINYYRILQDGIVNLDIFEQELINRYPDWNNLTDGERATRRFTHFLPIATINQPKIDYLLTNAPNVTDTSSNITLPNRRLTTNELNNWIYEYHTIGGASDFELMAVKFVNIAREAHGLAPLTICPNLMIAARFKSQEMQNLGYFGHTSPVYGSPSSMSYALFGIRGAENLFTGGSHSTTPNNPVQSWLRSDGHRCIMLCHTRSYVGFGSYIGGGGSVLRVK